MENIIKSVATAFKDRELWDLDAKPTLDVSFEGKSRGAFISCVAIKTL